MMNQMSNCGNGMMMDCHRGMGMKNCEMKCEKYSRWNCHNDDDNEETEETKDTTAH